MIDLSTVSGITLNSSSSASANSTALATLIGNMESGSVIDYAVTWVGDLYVASPFPFPFTSTGSYAMYFGIIGQPGTRLIYTGTSGYAINYTWTTPANQNDEHIRIDLVDITIQAPNASGLYLNDGGQSIALRNVTVSECSGRGIWIDSMSGMQLDNVYALGNTGDGITFNACTIMQLNGVTSRENGGCGVVFQGSCDAINGLVYAEDNGDYGIKADGLHESDLMIWQEANSQIRTGGSVGRNPSSPSSAVYPWGRFGQAVPQGSLMGCGQVAFKGSYGQNHNTDFDYDPQSRNLCFFPDDWRTFPLASPWIAISSNCIFGLPTGTGYWGSLSGVTVTNNSGGIAGKNTLAIAANALSGGYPSGYLEIRDPSNTYLGGNTYKYAADDLFAIEMDVTADSTTYSTLAGLRSTTDVQTVKMNALFGVGLDALDTYWYLPTSATSGPAKLRIIGAATGSGTVVRAFVYPVIGMISGPSSALNFTFSNINVWHLPAGYYY